MELYDYAMEALGWFLIGWGMAYVLWPLLRF